MVRTSSSPSSFLDRILIAPQLIGEGKFCAVCRLVFEKMEKDFFFEGRRPETIAYVIASNTLSFYYGNWKPIIKREMANRVGKNSINIYSITATGSKERYKEFQKRLFDLLRKMKNSKPLDFH